MSNVPMTVAGEAALRDELEKLKKVDRPRIIQAIAEAREHGDLKENAEYHAAREQQSFAEGRIMEIEAQGIRLLRDELGHRGTRHVGARRDGLWPRRHRHPSRRSL